MDKKLINIESLIKTNELLKQFLNSSEDSDELRTMGAVQAFEVCYELVWKTLQKFIAWEGLVANSPRETFRLAAQFGYINNPVTWFKFGEQRNLTVHTYQEQILTDVINLLGPFSEELNKLIAKLEQKLKK